ncbi:MAG TPA: glutamine synthetase adenylyltransferase [Planctomycetes bacterium]|nr:glutamine synthetase adenylyltransferase [Planctomycetota bacterium]
MFPRFDNLTAAKIAQNARLLKELGYSDPESTCQCLVRLRGTSLACHQAQSTPTSRSVPLWFKTLNRILLEAPDPEAVIRAADTFVTNSASQRDAFALFEATPRSLEVLARLACGSSFLTQTLLSDTEALRQLSTERRTAEMKSREEFHEEARAFLTAASDPEEQLSWLRRFQRRQILRIGMCDAFGLLDLKFVTLQISLLADAMVQVCLDIACQQVGVRNPPFSVLALGKHGGEELNYSSDIDLILIADADSPTAQRVARRMIDGLSDNLSTGFLYRVDMRLRPWGDAGPLVSTPTAYADYLQNHAELWEKQALLKVRLIAGDEGPGKQFLAETPGLLFTASEAEVMSNVRSMKNRIEEKLRRSGKLASEVKLGSGSIRDVEFLVQALQLIHGKAEPRLASANTLDALVRLTEFNVIDVSDFRQLREGYIFLRNIEHALQLMHNLQTHELPADKAKRYWLARRLDYPNESVLLERFDAHRHAVRAIFDRYFEIRPQQPFSLPAACDSVAPTDAETADRDLRYYLSRNEHLLTHVEFDIERCNGKTCHVQMASLPQSGDLKLVTVVSPDAQGLLSMICAVFFSDELDIRQGSTAVGPLENHIGFRLPADVFAAFFIVHASGPSRAGTDQFMSHKVERSLNELLGLSRSGDQEAIRRNLVDRFCDQLQQHSGKTTPQADQSLEISDVDATGLTRLEITADESFGFLFELSNALSLCGFRILRADLGTHDGRIRDVLHLTESDGSVIDQESRVEELRTAVTLIKQFTHWLPSNSDPHQSLHRFRDLLQRILTHENWRAKVASLRQPKVLRAVSRVLGVSRHLWEDFLRAHPDDLLPMLTDSERLTESVSEDDLRHELRQQMKDTQNPGGTLNQFKDRNLFRIDLRHVLGHCGPFGSFSNEITGLADVVVESACDVAWQELTLAHGVPRTESNEPCQFTIAGLGKFGGVEMGFASDIEMFLIFSDDCRSDGLSPLSGVSFFERLVNRITELVEARHKGIFEIDLRMRPYGQAGSAAVSLASFQNYYARDGDAWPFERQALVKLRCVGGDPEFAKSVVAASHAAIYSMAAFNFPAMRAMRERQVRQLVHGGTVNAKLSDGGLVDCEYAVQALQLSFGGQHAALRVSNTMAALATVWQAGLVSESMFHQAQAAYVFLRQLIDCLRMVRGNALDLTVPATDTADFVQLSRRLEVVHDSSLSADTLESHFAMVREFSQCVEQQCRKA